MIAIIDYGMGNLASVQNAFLKLNYPVFCTNNAQEILAAEKIVLPGVGAFGDAMHNLHHLGLDQVVKEVVNAKKPFLGICLGMQLLFSESEENGRHQGLDIIPGRVVRFQLPREYKIPHMGWNQVRLKKESGLWRGILDRNCFYFVHSYHVQAEDSGCAAGYCDYGTDFICAVEWGLVWATQFHPEKSGQIGLKILQNFGEL